MNVVIINDAVTFVTLVIVITCCAILYVTGNGGGGGGERKASMPIINQTVYYITVYCLQHTGTCCITVCYTMYMKSTVY